LCLVLIASSFVDDAKNSIPPECEEQATDLEMQQTELLIEMLG
jgi:hypothetical protein